MDVAAQPMVPLGAELGARCADLHGEDGVTLRLGVGVAALRGVERVQEVELADGSRLPADVVIVAFGVAPNVEWLEASGLSLDRGVVCDATLKVDDRRLAAGDIGAWPHPMADGEHIRVEHWTNAAEQGTLAGRNALLARERQAHEAVPYFWSDQYDVKIQAAGLPGLAAERHRARERRRCWPPRA